MGIACGYQFDSSNRFLQALTGTRNFSKVQLAVGADATWGIDS
jgi:hypothetical protein